MTESIIREKRPGEPMRVDTLNVSEEMSPDRCGALLINPSGRPDWVTDPRGDRARVIDLITLSEPRDCGKCAAELPAGTEVMVAEMPSDSTKLWFIYTCKAENCFVWEGRSRV